VKEIDVLIIGAGPAGLATAIRLKQRLNAEKKDASVVVIDKEPKLGFHNLSGGVFEAGCLDELVPGWREGEESFFKQTVEIQNDELYFLLPKAAFKIPHLVVPKLMNHIGDYAVSVSRMAIWLGTVAQNLGVEIYLGFSAKELLIEDGRVKGVKLMDLGLDRDGKKKSNFLQGETVHAKVTVLCDGSHGVLSEQLSKLLPPAKNPQVYSIGVKQLIKLPPESAFGNNRAIHTLGFPNRFDVFGGGFMYSMPDNMIAIGLILGLDWPYGDLNEQQELEVFKTHPLIARFLKDGKIVAAGANTIPEGGYYSIPKLFTNGALLVGDSAGFVNMEKIKGIHYAIRGGMSAADAILDALTANDFTEKILAKYEINLKESGILKELYHARNFRQGFKYGLPIGMPLSQIQSFIPFPISIEEDYKGTKKGRRLNRKKQDSMDRAQFVALSGSSHDENQPSHVAIPDPELCQQCGKFYAYSCTHFCPGEVYRQKDGKIVLSPSNCLHCQTCIIKCPFHNITWTPPEGGEGPRFKYL